MSGMLNVDPIVVHSLARENYVRKCCGITNSDRCTIL